ncbi:MAG: fibronectin type III domain-containing protein [Candidatus Rokubacteria bacterium CSP1-6]|nr:MAG: fibronectin type III domain-containing protein [Candidatus Rokubacteria bacterium CSP1-6]
MVRRQRVSIGIAALLSLAALLLPASARQSKAVVSALAPVEIVAEGLGHLRGVAVNESGAVFVTDAKAGTLLRVAPDGARALVMERLRHPVGVAVDREGRLVVVEEGRRQVLRLETGGGATSLISWIRHPRWVAVAPDGHLYVTAKSLASGDEEGEGDEVEPELVARVSPDGIATVFADRFRGLQGVAVAEDALRLVARGRRGERHPAGTLYEISIQPDGRAGPVQPVRTGELAGPVGLAADRLGAYFVSAKSLAAEPWRRGVVLKIAEDGAATLFAAGLDDPRGLAFAPDGSLHLADGNAGRILRFAAPRAPVVDEFPPAVTGERQVALRLRAEAGARLTVLGGQFPLVVAVDDVGSARVWVPLRRNAENHLLVFATGSAGLGLTSAPLPLSITQDEEPPALELLAPRAGALLRGTIAAEARATDLNGIADVQFRLDELTVGFDAAPPFRVSVDTAVVPDGLRVVSALARDRAGNLRSASVPVTVDNTRPEVRIVAPAPGAVVVGPIEVLVEAADATSGVAQVELAVNGTSRSVAETPPYRFMLDPRELGSGPQVLEAAAVDRAGNRGESPPVSVVLSGTPGEIQVGDLVAAPSSGVAPLTVVFSLLRATGGTIALDADGNGIVDFIGPSRDGQTFTYARPGLYFPTATITDAGGTQSTVTTVVNVEDPQTVTTRFQGLWTNLKARLGAGDVPGALAHLAPNLQPRFQTVFQQLRTDLPAVAASLGDLEVLEQVGDLAETAIVQQENGAPFLYFIYFRRDSLGRWLIEEM